MSSVLPATLFSISTASAQQLPGAHVIFPCILTEPVVLAPQEQDLGKVLGSLIRGHLRVSTRSREQQVLKTTHSYALLGPTFSLYLVERIASAWNALPGGSLSSFSPAPAYDWSLLCYPPYFPALY